MEIIGMILFILFFVIGMADKNKKKGNAAQTPGASADAKRQTATANARMARSGQRARKAQPKAPASAIPRRLDDLKGAMNQWFENTMDEIRSDAQTPVEPAAQPVQGASMLDDPECAGGSMPHIHAEGHSTLADEDCAGGSMEHTHTEGVSRVAQARRMAAIDAEHHDGAEILPETVDARALRRAVVMAEVLGKPRAMRKF